MTKVKNGGPGSYGLCAKRPLSTSAKLMKRQYSLKRIQNHENVFCNNIQRLEMVSESKTDVKKLTMLQDGTTKVCVLKETRRYVKPQLKRSSKTII